MTGYKIPDQCQTCALRDNEFCSLEPYAKLAGDGDFYEDLGGHIVTDPSTPCEHANENNSCEEFEPIK